MHNILNRPHSGVLEHFAWSRVLVAFDFDGTLAPIVQDPGDACVRPATARLCRRLATLYPCTIVSSRAARDLSRRVAHLGEWTTWSGTQRVSLDARQQIEEWLSAIGSIGLRFPRIEIEDKVSRLTIHYRRSRHKRSVVAAIQDAASRFEGARILAGKQVLHIQPADVADKGTAVVDLLQQHRCDTVVYVGDDETDEDVFALDLPGRLLAIRVGRNLRSRAAYYVPSQRCVDDLIALLVAMRAKVGQRIPGYPNDATGDDTAHTSAILHLVRELDHRREVSSRLLEQAHGVSAQQWAVLRIVGQFPGIGPGQVSESMSIHPSALTPLLKSLVDRGLVDRIVDRDDSRRQRLWLSARGRQLDVPLEGSMETAVAQAIARSSHVDLAAARRVLEALVDEIGRPLQVRAIATKRRPGGKR
jgi:trehalose 6-phosphate phosphatase